MVVMGNIFVFFVVIIDLNSNLWLLFNFLVVNFVVVDLIVGCFVFLMLVEVYVCEVLSECY